VQKTEPADEDMDNGENDDGQETQKNDHQRIIMVSIIEKNQAHVFLSKCSPSLGQSITVNLQSRNPHVLILKESTLNP
jgi:hypothetical protein